MTRQEYRAARRLYRDNGRYSFQWLTGSTREAMEKLHPLRSPMQTWDQLALRAALHRSESKKVAFLLTNYSK